MPNGGSSIERVDYDAELRLHYAALRRAFEIDRQTHVLDIGCGTGQTTRDAARMAVAGGALGVDLSEAMIERARQLTKAEGLHNAKYEVADAQSHRFPAECFDVAISRFGTMFFADPVAAFSNIALALRPGGRLVMMVWQNHDRNEWSSAIDRVLFAEGPAPRPGGLDPFSLGDPATLRSILNASGFVHAKLTEVHEPVYYGQNVAAALCWVRGFSVVTDRLRRLDRRSAECVLERLNDLLAAHAHDDGVWFDSRAWIVTARRRR
jgi:ubiquinone/menaquinone biosynthesis C-methylase UbiE